MPSAWTRMSDFEKDALLKRKESGEDVGNLALELDMNWATLDRYLRAWKSLKYAVQNMEEEEKAEEVQPEPVNKELFDALKKGPVSVYELSRMFDRSDTTIKGWISDMQAAGYMVQEQNNVVEALKKPTTVFKPARTLADEAGQELSFAWVSDQHAGSSHAQPSAIRKFVDIAYNEYGVRHILCPGDLTTGIFGYRGQEWDMIPALRSLLRNPGAATMAEVWLANEYTPQYPDLKYYIIGGNHDYWHIVKSGIDAVSVFCKSRPDCYFLGYDIADVPLTDRVSVRMWHPTGGVPYSLSYRVQKGLEQVAFDELERAVYENDNPKVRLLLAGHLHVEVKFHRGPMVGIQAGCFEGQTNYLKRKGLYPTVGGGIAKIRFTDGGLIQRFMYEFIPFHEVVDDWMNFPVPPEMEEPGIPDKVETLFSLA